MKQYLVFGPEFGMWIERGLPREGITGLKIIGQVRATDRDHALRAAKTRGFRNPIIKEKNEIAEVDAP